MALEERQKTKAQVEMFYRPCEHRMDGRKEQEKEKKEKKKMRKKKTWMRRTTKQPLNKTETYRQDGSPWQHIDSNAMQSLHFGGFIGRVYRRVLHVSSPDIHATSTHACLA